MYYFAYASNLNRKQMAGRDSQAKPCINAALSNYKLVFSGWSPDEIGESVFLLIFWDRVY
jgi:hypothetical protein